MIEDVTMALIRMKLPVLFIRWIKMVHKVLDMKETFGRVNSKCRRPVFVSIVVVNYNAGSLLTECVCAGLEQAEEVVVVDNASSDGSMEATGGTLFAGMSFEDDSLRQESWICNGL